MKKAAIFLADGCEEVEALTIIDVLRRGGVDAIGVSIMDSLAITGGHNIVFNADALFDDVNFDDIDMAVCPGGLGGTNNIKAHTGVKSVIQSFGGDKGKYVCAICAAPSALGYFGVLKGKRATCYPGFEDRLTGAYVENAEVVIDGNTITSQGPATAMAFALALLKALEGEKTAAEVQRGLLYK